MRDETEEDPAEIEAIQATKLNYIKLDGK